MMVRIDNWVASGDQFSAAGFSSDERLEEEITVAWSVEARYTWNPNAMHDIHLTPVLRTWSILLDV
jgi:hypothetical protein